MNIILSVTEQPDQFEINIYKNVKAQCASICLNVFNN